MNYIDYVIIILLIIAAVRGAMKGLVYEIASLVALIGGVWGAIKFSGATETFLTERLDFASKHIDVIAFVITFMLIIVLVHFIGRAIEKTIESISLGTINRLLGLVFSVFKMAFILGIVMILIEKFDESLPIIPENDVKESKLYEPLRGVAINTFPFIKNFYNDVKEEIQPNNNSLDDKDKNTKV